MYFATGLLAVPLWLMVSYRLGKRTTLMLALAYATCTTLLILLVPVGNMPAAVMMMATAGVAFGAGPFLLRSITADLSRRSEAATAMPVAGVFYGILLMAAKFGLALSVGISYSVLGGFGFVASLEGENSSIALAALKTSFIVVPAVVFGLSAWLIYGLNPREIDPEELQGEMQ